MFCWKWARRGYFWCCVPFLFWGEKNPNHNSRNLPHWKADSGRSSCRLSSMISVIFFLQTRIQESKSTLSSYPVAKEEITLNCSPGEHKHSFECRSCTPPPPQNNVHTIHSAIRPQVKFPCMLKPFSPWPIRSQTGFWPLACLTPSLNHDLLLVLNDSKPDQGMQVWMVMSQHVLLTMAVVSMFVYSVI